MRTSWRTRQARVAAACVVQLVLVGAAVWAPLSARLTGQEYLLAVAPVDPVDPFRGAYVRLGYPGLADALPEGSSLDGTVYVPLRRVGGVWEGGRAVRRRPDTGPYLRCAADHGWQLRCGIESLFASQQRARGLEGQLAEGAVARIRVDGRGNAAVISVGPDAGAR